MSYWSDAAWNEDHYNHNDSSVKFHVTENIKEAAVKHRCTLCGGTIEIGHPYTRQVGMSEGDDKPWVNKEHLSCYDEYEG